MRRLFFALVVFGTCVIAWGQTAPSDPQTLQAILTEVRALRQDLRVSQARVQSMQILLIRFQMQEAVVARASERLDEARSKLTDIQVNQKETAAEAKRLEDALSAEEDPQRQKNLRERIAHTKSELEVMGELRQQRQASEIQAEQQLRDEQDKLNALEGQLDELIQKMSTSAEQPGRNLP
jgi:hypothetical protein